MNFHELMRQVRATRQEQDACAWHLAMMRAKTLYEALKPYPDARTQA